MGIKNPNTQRCTVPNCNRAEEGKSKVCNRHKHTPQCRCRKCTQPAGGNDFHSRAPVTLVPMPWEVAT